MTTISFGFICGKVSQLQTEKTEKNFWDFIKKTLSDIGSDKATMSQPVVVTH
ncbi:MAG: hypothetical protein WCF03_13085 [Nitrososphaeraceae archaeon]